MNVPDGNIALFAQLVRRPLLLASRAALAKGAVKCLEAEQQP